MIDALLSEAIVLWTGWGKTSSPQRDESRLVDSLGSERAIALLPKVRKLEDEFYESNARHVSSTLEQMGTLASTEFRNRHPEISKQAVEALAWCYTFDYK